MKRKDVTTIAVTVNGREWSRALSFRNAGPDDAIYVLDQRDGAISFGDGSHGRTPPVGSTIGLSYRDGPDLLETFPNILMTRETSRNFGLSCVAGIRPSGGESDRAKMLLAREGVGHPYDPCASRNFFSYRLLLLAQGLRLRWFVRNESESTRRILT